MSRGIVFLILGVLLVLLGVMGFVVNPKPPGPPTPQEIAAHQEEAKKRQEMEMKQKQQQMKAMLKANEKMKVEQEKAHKEAVRLGLEPKQSPLGPAPSSGPMDISNNWFHRHPDGEQGLSKLEAVSKAQDAFDKRADQIRAKMFTGGDVGPNFDKVKPHMPAPKTP